MPRPTASDDPYTQFVVVTLREITDGNREAVLALHVAPEQERFVGSVQGALREPSSTRTPSRGTGRSTRTTSRSGS